MGGAQADPKLLKAASCAHHKAIGSISGPNGVTSKADWEAVNAALGRVIASVPESTVMDVYNSVSAITDPGVPAYLKSLENGAAAKKLSDASYPFLKSVDWTSDLYIKPLPGVSAKDALKAVDKAIVMGVAADGNALA